MAIISEDQDPSARRKPPNLSQVLLNDRHAGPEPVAKNSDVECLVFEERAQRPFRFLLVAEASQTLRIVGAHPDSQDFQLHPVTLRIFVASREVGDLMPFGAKFSNYVQEPQIRSAAVMVRQQFMDQQNILRRGG